MWNLMMDDDPGFARLTSRMLREVIETRIVPGGESGLRLLRSVADDPEELPASVVLDLQMPDFHGHEVLRLIRGDPRLESVPVIVFTSSLDPEDERRSRRLGATDHLRKPRELDGFGELVRRIRTLVKGLAHPMPDPGARVPEPEGV